MGSSFSLGLLLLATFVPLYNVTRTEDTEAAAGTAQDSSITFTSTRSTASVDLTVTDENGTFASSTSSNQAAFSLSTTNFTGYTLTIASNTDTSTLSNGNGGTLSSISEPIDESTFNTTAYNNKWGYKPNYYNSAANSNYLQSPTTTASTLDETSTANSTAKNYTIALGARADYTNASGTYTSSNYKLMYVANPVAYSISYDKGNTTDTVSNLPGNQSSSNVSTTSMTLSSTVPSRTGYDFIGWCLGTITTTNNVDECSNTNIYNPNGDGTNLTFGIDRTIANNVTLHAMWSINSYTLSITNDGNASVNGAGTYQYGQTVTLTATPNPNTTCKSYSTPTWSKTSGEGTLNSTSGTSVTFTMGAGNATVTATSTASNKYQTVTLSKGTGVSSIKIGNSTYSGSSASLTCGSYTISGNYSSGYEFSSWSRSGSVTVSNTSSASTTMTVNGAGTLTLNAKQSKLYMQAMTSSDCTTTAKTVYDNRDQEAYLVQKLADGKCWMLDNLRLGSTSTIALTTADSNTNGNYTLPASGSWSNSYNVAYINSASKNNTTTGYGSGSKKIGVYYNYCAASAGTYCYASDSGTGNASYDVCPKGWRMPTGGSSGEYESLYTAYSSNATNFRAALSTPLSGYFYDSSANRQGSNGNFWSSTYGYGSGMYSLYVGSSGVDPTDINGRVYGFSVRCILK